MSTDATTVSDLFVAQVAARGDVSAILDSSLDMAYTWRQYGAAVRRLAAGVVGLGLPDSDELTPTMKLKRRPIAQKYATRIEALYSTKGNQ